MAIEITKVSEKYVLEYKNREYTVVDGEGYTEVFNEDGKEITESIRGKVVAKIFHKKMGW